MHKNNIEFLSGWSFSEHMWKPFKSLKSDEKVLIGWSLGGLLAIQRCLSEQSSYKKLILINSAPHFPQFSMNYWKMANSDLSEFQYQFLRWVFYPIHQKKVSGWQECFIASTDNTRDTLIEQLKILFITNLSESYQKLTLPILHLQGSNDSIVQHKPLLDGPHETFVQLSGGHALPFTHTEILINKIQEFLCC